MTRSNPLKGWQVDPATIELVGSDLRRPECVLAEADGTLWSADARGGAMRIDPDGSQTLVAPERPEQGSLPNGLAFAPDGSILIADFGIDALERMTRDGESTSLYTEIDREPLGKTNFVLVDSRGRIWFTVTTRLVPWIRSVNEKASDGYVGIVDDDGIRIVIDGFVGTNEIRFDEREEWLYVVESNGRRISRLRAHADGSLTDREIYGPPDLGGIPDGFAFDQVGNLWITLVNADRLIALTPDGEVLTLLDDGDPDRVAAWDEHFFAATMTLETLAAPAGTLAPMMASVTFGGPDLRTVYLGSLMGTSLPSFRSPVPGLPLSHWSQTSTVS